MSVENIRAHKPLWTRKLSDEKLKKYLDSINELEINKHANELLLDTAKTWYYNHDENEKLKNIINDIYKECATRWYDLN